MPLLPRLLVLAGLLFGSGISVAQTDADRQIRADYQKVVAARNEMSGEMDAEARRSRMDNYFQTCESFVAKWASRSGDLTTGLFDLGRAYVEVADPAKAGTHLASFLQKFPEHADAEEAKLVLGDVYRSTNKLDEAATLYRDFIASYPKSARLAYARLGLATTHFFKLDFDRAIADYRTLLAAHADHAVAADASYQLIDALTYNGDYAAARKLVGDLLAQSSEAVELERKRDALTLLGNPAPPLVGLERWVGVPGGDLDRAKGRVVVLCFFMTKSVPCARALQDLSSLERDFSGRGVSVWGITKAYKAGKADWDMNKEVRWLQRYRENPRFVVQRELRVRSESGDQTSESMWQTLEKPIACSLALTPDFINHRAYGVRGVPATVVIDRAGKVRLVEEGGGPDGGFQGRLLRRVISKLLVE